VKKRNILIVKTKDAYRLKKEVIFSWSIA
jgi:hypothetical protein